MKVLIKLKLLGVCSRRVHELQKHTLNSVTIIIYKPLAMWAYTFMSLHLHDCVIYSRLFARPRY